MTYYDASGGEREDRIIVGYNLEPDTAAVVNLSCNGETPQVVIDLGGNPIEIELVTSSPDALADLIRALHSARRQLRQHIDHHAADIAHVLDQPITIPDTVPDDWTGENS